LDGSAILESTAPRDIYFGVILDGPELTTILIGGMLGILEDCGINLEANTAGHGILLTRM
jgi:hypothetical protein